LATPTLATGAPFMWAFYDLHFHRLMDETTSSQSITQYLSHRS
jgi:hypothetical protein